MKPISDKTEREQAREELRPVDMIAWFLAGSSWVWVAILAIGVMAIAIRVLGGEGVTD